MLLLLGPKWKMCQAAGIVNTNENLHPDKPSRIQHLLHVTKLSTHEHPMTSKPSCNLMITAAGDGRHLRLTPLMPALSLTDETLYLNPCQNSDKLCACMVRQERQKLVGSQRGFNNINLYFIFVWFV